MSDYEDDDVSPPVFRLKIWCTDDDVNHDGYCSDAGTPVHDVNRRQLIQDIPANLPDDVIKANGAVDITCTQITALEYEQPHGNGYCGLRSTRTITRAMIVKNPTLDYVSNWPTGPSNQLTSDREDDDDYDSEYDYETDDEICRCRRCNCRRRCRCGPCTCESLYKNRKTGTEYLESKRECSASDEEEEEDV